MLFSLASFENLPFTSHVCWYSLIPVALGTRRPVDQLFKVNLGYAVNWRPDGYTHIKHIFIHIHANYAYMYTIHMPTTKLKQFPEDSRIILRMYILELIKYF